MLAAGACVPSGGATVSRVGDHVVVVAAGEVVLDVHWRAADELCDAVRLRCAGVIRLGFATVVHEPERVDIVLEGRAVLDLERSSADALARAVRAKAREAEQEEDAERVAYDQAIVTRAGAPFGLTNDPRIQAEAVKLAVSDERLRRYMPGGVRSTVVLGTPTVVVHPPKEEP